MNKQPNLDYPYIGIPDTDEKEIENYNDSDTIKNDNSDIV